MPRHMVRVKTCIFCYEYTYSNLSTQKILMGPPQEFRLKVEPLEKDNLKNFLR
jgi:hypothetical protein